MLKLRLLFKVFLNKSIAFRLCTIPQATDILTLNCKYDFFKRFMTPYYDIESSHNFNDNRQTKRSKPGNTYKKPGKTGKKPGI